MAMVVRSNLMAYNANRQLGMNNSAVSKNLEKLSSGFKINRAADDAAGLAVSEKMKAQIKGLEQASLNSQDGISLVQTAEGALTEVHDMLNRMTELATKSANGTIQDQVDREAIQNEVNKLNEEIDRIADSTNFNGIKLLNGNLSGGGSTSAAAAGVPKIDGLTLTDVEAAKGEYESAAISSKDTNAAAGDSFKYALTYKDASGKTSTINLSFTVGNHSDGTAKKGLIAADGTQYDLQTAEAVTKAELKKVIEDQLSKTAIKDTFKVTVGADGKVSFAAKKAGSKESAGEIVGFKEETSIGGTVTQNALNVTTKTAKDPGDAYQKIGNTGFKNKEVFTVGGKKFALVETAEELAALESGVNGLKVSDAETLSDPEMETLAKLIEQKTGYGATVDTTADEIHFKASTATSSNKSGGGLTLQIGESGDDFNQVTVSVDNMKSSGIGTAGLDVSTQDAAKAAIQTIKDGINKVSTNRSELGALQNRLEHTINNLDVTAENMTNANSRIRDTDMAKQMMEYTKMNVLTQSAQAMLAQANQNPQSILQLLQ